MNRPVETVVDRVRAERAAQGLPDKVSSPELLAPVAKVLRAAKSTVPVVERSAS